MTIIYLNESTPVGGRAYNTPIHRPVVSSNRVRDDRVIDHDDQPRNADTVQLKGWWYVDDGDQMHGPFATAEECEQIMRQHTSDIGGGYADPFQRGQFAAGLIPPNRDP